MESPRERAATSEYRAEEGNALTLRDELTPGTLRQLERLDSRPGASAEDRWQRRMELLFERLAVRWTISGVPTEGQRELLAGLRGATPAERRWVRDALREHVAEHFPELQAP